MARIITQDTFNDIVLENKEVFEMAEDEAIEEAVSQLEAQGVNLSCIMKDTKKATAIKEQVIKLLNTYDEVSTNEQVILQALNQLEGLLNGELAAKILAAKEGLYPILKSLMHSGTALIVESTLTTFISLMNGYPDLLDEDGLSLLLESISPDKPITNISLGLKWMVACVTKHEKTRAMLIKSNVAVKLKELGVRYGNEVDVISNLCAATNVLLLDDDVRVVSGDAHEHARALANELLSLLINLMPKFVSNERVTENLLFAITSLLVRNEFCIALYEEGGLKYVLDVAVEHPDNEKITREWFLLLKSLAGSDEVKEQIIANGAAPLLVSALERHYKSSSVAVAGCLCLAALSLRSPSNSTSLAAAGAPETLVRCMVHWKKNKVIMLHGCAAIRNQVSRCPELRAEYVYLQVEELLRLVKDSSGNLDFQAKSVLLELGCDVELKEEWKGKGTQLAN